jgi:alpha-L-rhamnosidase
MNTFSKAAGSAHYPPASSQPQPTPANAISCRLSSPGRLLCEYLKNPIGIGTAVPRFSWELKPLQRGARQGAWRIAAASTREAILSNSHDLWDSGRTESAQNIHVEYQGKPLASGQIVWWRVMAWDSEGTMTAWSPPASFEIGLLSDTDWHGEWIAAPENISSPMMRRKFLLSDKSVTRARIYVSGLGYSELYVNGMKSGDRVLDPVWTDYDTREMRDLAYPYVDKGNKRVCYVTHDVTSLLVPGGNAVGVMLGNGMHNQKVRLAEGKMWYGRPRMLLELRIDYMDGSQDVVKSDADWRCCGGPILFNNVFVGEIYDARCEKEGWTLPDYDPSDWAPVESALRPTGKLTAQTCPPDRVVGTLPPTRMWTSREGNTIFDFGRVFSGWVRIRVQGGSAGDEIAMRFSEEIEKDGELDFKSAGGEEQIQRDVYVLSGKGKETYEPRFVWHAFRYVELRGLPAPIDMSAVDGRVVHSDVARTGRFACSNPLLERINELFVWTQLLNMHGGVPSDCPHRERLGYTGDGQLVASSAVWNLWMPQFYTKWIDDIADAQNVETGFVPHTAPFYGGGGGPGWGAACVVLPSVMQSMYGDNRIVEQMYSCMDKWLKYLDGKTDGSDIIIEEEPGSWCLGDWSTPVNIGILMKDNVLPSSLVNTFVYGMCARQLGTIAQALGRADDAKRYQAKSAKIAASFHRKFYDKERGTYLRGLHGASAFALVLGAVPADVKARVVDNLAEHVLGTCSGHLDTGIMGTPVLLEALAQEGRFDVAYEIISKTTAPGFGFMIASGATTMWESWSYKYGSHCHPMFGSVSDWMYRYIVGIRQDQESSGFNKISIVPWSGPELTHASAQVHTLRGQLGVRWEKSKMRSLVDLDIPVGCHARILVSKPDSGKCRLFESGIALEPGKGEMPAGINAVSEKREAFLVDVESGKYVFTAVTD